MTTKSAPRPKRGAPPPPPPLIWVLMYLDCGCCPRAWIFGKYAPDEAEAWTRLAHLAGEPVAELVKYTKIMRLSDPDRYPLLLEAMRRKSCPRSTKVIEGVSSDKVIDGVCEAVS